MKLLSSLDYRHIYILGNTRYLFRYKIGIAYNLDNRKRGISNSMKGDIYEIYSVKLFFAQKIEKTLHRIYSPLNAKMRGSGKTEWFWMILPVSPTLLLMLIWAFQWFLIPTLIVSAMFLINHQKEILSIASAY